VRRKKALEEGPLVEARVLWCEDHLRKRGRRAGSAVVVFRVDEEGRWDGDALASLAAALEDSALVEELIAGAEPEEGLSLKNEEKDALVRVPRDAVGEAVETGEAYLGRVVVYPDRLVDRKLAVGDRLVLIVDTDEAFLEQLPQG
jgi:hypothetical protein